MVAVAPYKHRTLYYQLVAERLALAVLHQPAYLLVVMLHTRYRSFRYPEW